MKKPEVVRRERDFQKIYRRGKPLHGKYMVLFALPVAAAKKKTGPPIGRHAVVASKKVGGAVTRNRARRLLKEAWRNAPPPAANKFDVLLVAKAGIENCKMPQVAAELQALGKKACTIR